MIFKNILLINKMSIIVNNDNLFALLSNPNNTNNYDVYVFITNNGRHIPKLIPNFMISVSIKEILIINKLCFILSVDGELFVNHWDCDLTIDYNKKPFIKITDSDKIFISKIFHLNCRCIALRKEGDLYLVNQYNDLSRINLTPIKTNLIREKIVDVAHNAILCESGQVYTFRLDLYDILSEFTKNSDMSNIKSVKTMSTWNYFLDNDDKIRGSFNFITELTKNKHIELYTTSSHCRNLIYTRSGKLYYCLFCGNEKWNKIVPVAKFWSDDEQIINMTEWDDHFFIFTSDRATYVSKNFYGECSYDFVLMPFLTNSLLYYADHNKEKRFKNTKKAK